MYFNFISLKDAPLSVQEVVENMHMTVNGEWYFDDEVEKEKAIASLQDTKKILADVMTLNYKDEQILLLFQMAIYRFCKMHIPNIMKNLEKDEFGRIELRLYEDQLNDWEKEFWKVESRGNRGLSEVARSNIWMGHSSLSYYRKELRDVKPIAKNSDYYYAIENTMDAAFKDVDTSAKVKALQQEYEALAHNAERINTIQRQQMEGNKDELLKTVKDIKKIADILERNIQGTLTAGDVMELRENSGEWSNGMNTLMNLLTGIE